jgi:uncharacterized coiled-coil DUF342 family protein
MTEPHWTGYVGMLSGIIGVGVALFSNWKVNKIKSLDLRLELKKLVLNINSNLVQLDELMDLANSSRTNMSAARGRTTSGEMVKWKDEYQKALSIKDTLLQNAPDPSNKYTNLSPHKLENKLIELFDYAGKVNTLCDKYKQEIQKDEEDRKQLKEDFRVSSQLKG